MPLRPNMVYGAVKLKRDRPYISGPKPQLLMAGYMPIQRAAKYKIARKTSATMASLPSALSSMISHLMNNESLSVLLMVALRH
jgi:hypothetical protein